MKKLVYIAAPLNAPTRAGIEANRRIAARWVAWAAQQGFAPIATWITLSGEWEESPENRRLGLEIDKALVERCDAVWLVGGRISEGMRIESEHAHERGVTVVDLTHYGVLPPGFEEQSTPLDRVPDSATLGRGTVSAPEASE